jgi:aquaporin Z
VDSGLTKRLIVEFLGPFALCFAGIGTIVMTQGGDIVAIALAHGLAIGLMVMAVGHVSGGHFNPAVTSAMIATRKIDPQTGLMYIVAQLAGAGVAAIAILLTFPESMTDPVNLAVPAVGPGFSSGNALIAEIITTFFLVFVIFGIAVDKRSPKPVYGLVIGLTITMGILATGAVSGAALNPARWFGPALIGGHFDNLWIWIAGPILGGVAAGFLQNDILLAGEKDA